MRRESGDHAAPDSVSRVAVRRRGFDLPSGDTIHKSFAALAGS
jgi:hypothetical protein